MSITEKELAEIKGRIAEGRRVPPFDVRDLADEVTRLRAELAKAREVTDEKVERAADAMIAASPDRDLITESEREWYVRDARVALQTTLGGGDDA